MSILFQSVALATSAALILCASTALSEDGTKFLRYDRDANGEISEPEFTYAYKTANAPAIFRKLDTNNSGDLSEYELEQLTEKKRILIKTHKAPQ